MGFVWAVGDGADGSAGSKAAAAQISNADRFIYLGDVYENGTASEMSGHYDTVYGASSSNNLKPVTYPVIGNHEAGNINSSGGYNDYWAARLNRQRYYVEPLYNGWTIIHVNSEESHGSGSAQVTWLQQQLASDDGTMKIVCHHRARYSAGKHGDQTDMDPVYSAMQGHALIALCGHDHDYQRFAPVRGITQLIVGSGGHSHYAVGSRSTLLFSDDTHYGVLRMTLNTNGTMSGAWIDSSGTTRDTFSLTATPPSTGTGGTATPGFSGYETPQIYSLLNRAVWVEMPTVPNTGGTGNETEAGLEFRVGNVAEIPDALRFIWRDGVLRMGQTVAGTETFGTLTYNATTHRWLRIRHSGTAVFWDTSPDGSTWTNRRTAPLLLTITSGAVRLYSGFSGTVAAPGFAEFDNVNLNIPTGTLA